MLKGSALLHWKNGEVFRLLRMTGGKQLHFGRWSDLTTCPRHPSLILLWQDVQLINTQRSDPYQSNSFPNGLPHTFLKSHCFCHILLSMFLSFAANHRVIAVHASKGHRLHSYSTTFLPSHQMANKQNSTTNNNKKEHVASLSEKKMWK